MLCCVGLFGGLAVGQAMGGPWTVIAPAAGFGIGFVADMKLMKGMHGKGHQQHAPAARAERNPDQPGGAEVGGVKSSYQLQDAGKA